jgi:hypothetical protein
MCFNDIVKRIWQLILLAAIAFPVAAQQSKPQAVGEIFASDAAVRGAMVMASGGTHVMSGSQVEAGDTAAVFKLARGGQVRICPGTNLAVSASTTGPELMFGMNTGAVEADYRVGPFSDSIVTPDFRLQLAGPGTFHVAIGSGANGDTCIRSLAGNAASLIVNEMMGNGTYQVRAGDSVTFHGGKLTAAEEGAASCGCPAPPPPVELAQTPAPVAAAPSPTVAPAQPAETHVELDTPLVFRGGEDQHMQDLLLLGTLRTSHDNTLVLSLQPRLDPAMLATARAPIKKKGFFARLGGALSKVFR